MTKEFGKGKMREWKITYASAAHVPGCTQEEAKFNFARWCEAGNHGKPKILKLEVVRQNKTENEHDDNV